MDKEKKETYYIDGIRVPETPKPGENPPPWKKTNVIGQRKPRIDAYERVSGTAVFPSDIQLPDMLYGAVLRCPHPHARVKKIDTDQAEKMPGICAVLSPSSKLAELKWPHSEEIKTDLFDPRCRFEGEAIAAVVAETPYQTIDALKAIRVDYDVMPFISDEQKALQDGAPSIHPKGNTVMTDKYERGNVEKGFAEADVVLEETYRTACQLHTPLELHGCVAKWDGDRLTIWESSQGVFAVQSRVAQILGMPLSKVRVIGHYMGGGFGSKLQPGKYTIIAALLARKTARPVKIFLSREETFLCAGNRPPVSMHLKAGVKKDGTLTALDFMCTGSGGAYPAGGTSLVDWQIRDLYTCPNVRTASTDVYINAGPARPMRAPGHPQGSWALEQMLDALAVAIGMDPVMLRLKNVPAYSQAREGNPPYTTTGLGACFSEGSKAFEWQEARARAAEQNKQGHIRRGVGVAGSLWIAGGGRPPSTVIVKLFADGSVNLNMGASDIGTGTKTVMAMVVSEELGIQPEMIQIEHADTGTTQYASPSGGSKTVPTESPAVRDAVIQVKRQLLEMAARDLKVDPADLVFEGETLFSKKDASKRIGIANISGLKLQGEIVGVGYRGPNPEKKVVNPFAVQFCEVEVNMKTGELRVVRFLSAHDSGRVMNRLTFDNQVFGGIAMGIGFGAMENRVLDIQTGKMANKNWHDYKIPTMLDIPDDMVSLPIDVEDTEANTTGAKGLGEPVTIPTAAALANAVYHATGIRMTESPISLMRLCQKLGTIGKEG